MRKYLKMLFKALLIGALSMLLIVVACNIWIYSATADLVKDSIEEVPDKAIALVLGTSPKLMTGDPNPYFQERIAMAAELLKRGKVKHIIVSGDNRTKYYNEPIKMYNALLELGISKDQIELDYAGIRTLDSIVRCKEIFGQTDVIIITQPFHSYRALFISQYYDMDAVSLSITNIPSDFSYKVKLREYFARTLAIVDLYVLKTQPKFLGEKETINI